ncbi:MAG: hypothetical protein HY819_19565 [Acidobacteria bacterium]|nr:hypothetical protein [Acidobacteriota bacterium]
MSRYKLSPIDLSKTQSYSLFERPSKVTKNDFANPYKNKSSFSTWLENLPNILAVKDLKNIAQAVVNARRKERAVIIGLGGHVIKCGLAPVLIDLMKQGFITGFAMNGSAAIHDFEIALAGFTSEDVDASLSKGDFGMAEETGQIINQASFLAVEENIGFGEALGKTLIELNPTNSDVSLLCTSYQEKAPLTIHLAIGTDIVHMHKSADGAKLGAATHQDFRLFCSMVRELSGGGVYLNLGSAVLMPEVFLKAVTVIRNLELPLEDFTTANLDFIQHYRPLTNVVKRPVAGVGKGYALTGHHELLIPLLAAAIIELSN